MMIGCAPTGRRRGNANTEWRRPGRSDVPADDCLCDCRQQWLHVFRSGFHAVSPL